jgi:hypothetical protein
LNVRDSFRVRRKHFIGDQARRGRPRKRRSHKTQPRANTEKEKQRTLAERVTP